MDFALQQHFSPIYIKGNQQLQNLPTGNICLGHRQCRREKYPARNLPKTTPYGRPTQLLWPYQANPSPKDWRIWLLFLCFLYREGKLHLPLGSWISQPHQQWQWYSTPRKDKVYNYDHNSDSWTEYTPLNVNTSRHLRNTKSWFCTLTGTTITHIPFPLHPMAISFSHDQSIFSFRPRALLHSLRHYLRQTPTPGWLKTLQNFSGRLHHSTSIF